MAAGYEMRVGDAEREAAASELREHFASGRLNQDELDERLNAAFAAKTRGDLKALFADLPSAGHGWASAGTGGGAATGSGPWTGAPGPSAGWAGRGDWRAAAAGGIGRIVLASALMWVLLIVGLFSLFGLGGPRPFGIVLLIAAFALLRRVFFMIFGRRRAGARRGCGPRRRW